MNDNLFSHATEAQYETTTNDEATEGTTMPVFSHLGK